MVTSLYSMWKHRTLIIMNVPRMIHLQEMHTRKFRQASSLDLNGTIRKLQAGANAVEKRLLESMDIMRQWSNP